VIKTSKAKGDEGKAFRDAIKAGYSFSGFSSKDRDAAINEAARLRSEEQFAKVIAGTYSRRASGSSVRHLVYTKHRALKEIK